MSFSSYLTQSADVITQCAPLSPQLETAIDHVVKALASGKPLLVCGNGGSAADAAHIAGELVGRFMKERKAYKVICLTSNHAFMTAWSNDYDYESVFARQVEGFGEPGAVLLALSTSGNSTNVVKAFEQAHTQGMTTIALTGQTGGKLAPLSDVLLDVPSKSTPLIQQAHICMYHYLCAQVAERLG